MQDIAEEKARALVLQTELESGNAATQDDVRVAQQALSELRAKREAASNALTEKKVRRMALQKEQDAVANEQKRLCAEQERIRRQAEDQAQTIAAEQAHLDGIR